MAVTEGRNARITVRTLSTGTESVVVAEMGTWSISGVSRNMIDVTSFGDTVMGFKPGMLDPGSITFTGFYDPTDSSGQAKIISSLSSGISISDSTSRQLRNLRIWGSMSTSPGSTDVYGFWSSTGSTGAEIFITSMELATDKNNVGTISLTAKVSGGRLAWSATTST